MKIAIIATLLAASAIGPAAAETDTELPAVERGALDRHLSDLTACLAYYSIAEMALQRAGEEDTADRLHEIKSTLLDRSFIVMLVVDMDQETALDRQKTAMDDQMRLIGNDLSRLPLLTQRYGMFCKEVVEAPEERLEHWRKRIEGGPPE